MNFKEDYSILLVFSFFIFIFVALIPYEFIIRSPKDTSAGIFFMAKIKFFIDGFNLYHSIVSIEKTNKEYYKWLDIAALCKSYLPNFPSQSSIVSIKYLTALPEHLRQSNPGRILRHRAYISCLETTGVEVLKGRFKGKSVYCPSCRGYIQKHEEKETDVNIAISILESFITDECDIAAVVTGDTDLTPVIHMTKKLFPQKELLFIFPYDRENKEIKNLLPKSFSIKKKSYRNYQLPNPMIIKGGKAIYKPIEWFDPAAIPEAYPPLLFPKCIADSSYSDQ